jgi:predicted dehydrogenase
MLASGVLGAVQRVVWTVTDWYRTQAYYDSAPWRGTWCGEGGGVLVNQAVHQLDLWCWLFGLPTRLQARCSFGAWHDIGVEDEVSMLCDLPGGGSGVFIASTGSSPGVNRLEVDCDQGRMVVDAEGLTWQRTSMAVGAHRRHSPNRAEHLPITREHVAHPNHGPQLAGILADFAIACRTGCSPLAPVAVVRAQIALANAILVAACQGTAVELPLTAGRFAALHGELMQREKARNQPRMARAVG